MQKKTKLGDSRDDDIKRQERVLLGQSGKWTTIAPSPLPSYSLVIVTGLPHAVKCRTARTMPTDRAIIRNTAPPTNSNTSHGGPWLWVSEGKSAPFPPPLPPNRSRSSRRRLSSAASLSFSVSAIATRERASAGLKESADEEWPVVVGMRTKEG